MKTLTTTNPVALAIELSRILARKLEMGSVQSLLSRYHSGDPVAPAEHTYTAEHDITELYHATLIGPDLYIETEYYWVRNDVFHMNCLTGEFFSEVGIHETISMLQFILEDFDLREAC